MCNSGLSAWLARRRDEILRKWRDNQIGYGDALAALVQLGINQEAAHQLLIQ